MTARSVRLRYQHRAVSKEFCLPVGTRRQNGTAAGSVGLRLRVTGGARASRKPWLLFRLVGSFLLRYAAWQLEPLLFQLPPRFTRAGPCGRSPAAVVGSPAGARP
jgi:hypothetical protein